MNNKFEKLSLEGLLALNEADSDSWSHEWENEVRRKAKKTFWGMNFVELMEFDKDHPDEGIAPWFDAWDEAICRSYPFEQILGRITRIEKTLDVIMKATGGESAKITIAQLSRLKGGI